MTNLLLIAALSLVVFAGLQVVPSQASAGDEARNTTDKTIYDFTVKDIDGEDVKLSKYKGGVLLIVNVASKWGYTKRTYSSLESIYNKYKDQGLQILAFPANNFGKQEPGVNSEIKTFCTANMKVSFDLFAKVSVLGDDQVPLFKFLSTYPNEKVSGDIQWNFEKYLVGRDGTVIQRFGTRTLPTDSAITEPLEKELAKKTE